MRKHANKVLYVVVAVGAAAIVQVVGATLGRTWQVSVATLFVLGVTAAVALLISARVRNAARKVDLLLKASRKPPAAPPDARALASIAKELNGLRTAVARLADANAGVDSRMAHLTQVATQLAVEMDVLRGVVQHESREVAAANRRTS